MKAIKGTQHNSSISTIATTIYISKMNYAHSSENYLHISFLFWSHHYIKMYSYLDKKTNFY